MMRGSRLRQVSWAAALGLCLTIVLALHFQVSTVRSEVRLTERRIVALEREKDMLETEYQTRASQQNLSDLNRVEFGYQPPQARQFLGSARQLAAYGAPRGPGAPDPIRVARAAAADEEGGLPAMLSPLTGEPAKAAELGKAEPGAGHGEPMKAPYSLSERLTRSNPLSAARAEDAQ